MCVGYRNGPAGEATPRDPDHEGSLMATQKSSAPHAHPSTEDRDDTVEAHYSCLERLCACYAGWVFVGYIEEYGEEREASYRCRRCDDSR
jgi:hypothetical protein